MTVKAGIVGWPVTQSLSPVLHGYWLKQLGIDGEMLRVPAPVATRPSMGWAC